MAKTSGARGFAGVLEPSPPNTIRYGKTQDDVCSYCPCGWRTRWRRAGAFHDLRALLFQRPFDCPQCGARLADQTAHWLGPGRRRRCR